MKRKIILMVFVLTTSLVYAQNNNSIKKILDNPGSYTVTLTASNSYGSDLEVKTGYITVTNDGGGNTFTDPRDGQTYTTVEIGSQTWMTENLNYATANSWWYR